MAKARRDKRTAGATPPAVFFAPAHDPFARSDPPVWSVILWPHRSLPRQGFRTLMWICAGALSLPVIAFAGTAAGLIMAVACGLSLFLLWAMFRLNYFSGRLTEELRLWPEAIAVERREPMGRVRRWSANPYWVEIEIRDTREVENYLTLRGGGRTIELGAFLTPEERAELESNLRSQIAALHRPG